jgi:hypothetical protein
MLQDEEIHFSDGTALGDSNKKFFELTPVEFDVQESFTNYDSNAHQENNEDRRYMSLVFAVSAHKFVLNRVKPC